MLKHRPKEIQLPKTIIRDSRFEEFKDDIVGAWDISVHFSNLACKTIIFRTRKGMRRFQKKLCELGIDGGGLIGKSALGFVCKLMTMVVKVNEDGSETTHYEVDPKYFALCCLVEGYLNQDIVPHESMHVGFAYDFRKAARNKYFDPEEDISEERVCYPSGVYNRMLMRVISREGIRCIGGDSKRWRDTWDDDMRKQQHCYLHHILWYSSDKEDQAYVERYRKALARSRKNQ